MGLGALHTGYDRVLLLQPRLCTRFAAHYRIWVFGMYSPRITAIGKGKKDQAPRQARVQNSEMQSPTERFTFRISDERSLEDLNSKQSSNKLIPEIPTRRWKENASAKLSPSRSTMTTSLANSAGVTFVTAPIVSWVYGINSFGANLTIEEEKVEFPKGKGNLKMYTIVLLSTLLLTGTISSRRQDPDTLSGTPLQRYFCQTCGVPIMSVTPLYKGKVVLKLGLYPKLPVPEWESFASQRQSWEKPLEGAVQYKTKSFGEKMPGSI
ncbi:hypothetical protein FOPE_02289 [Fonsecaea pedrosoi]|nr:hypothetical protein FOPE_02289 [Fonsecaea pedrosoi]